MKMDKCVYDEPYCLLCELKELCGDYNGEN